MPDAEETGPGRAERLKTLAKRLPMFFGLLVFGFGVAAGFLLAFSGYGLEDSAAMIVSVFLALILGLLVLGVIAVMFRRPIMRRLFGLSSSHLEQFAAPLTRIAEGAAARDPTGATQAARELLQLAFARFAWISTRRWLIASLTGLIAAMAALSGTALLFKQNQLLERQSVVLREQTNLLAQQNARITEQTGLLSTQVELAEAARNGELAVEITNIAALLGAALDAAEARDGQGGATGAAGLVPVLDPVRDISQSLRMRIISASQASRPYRFLASPLNAHDTSDKLRVASLRRRDDLPQFYAGAQQVFRWTEPTGEPGLIDRPASPERAQLLRIMIRAGLREFETFNFYGFDLSFADAADLDLFGISMQGGQLSYASFARAHVLESDFGGASLENARFDAGWIARSTFRPFDAASAKGPYAGPEAFGPTFLSGASFRAAFLRDVVLDQAQLMTADFDGATLLDVSMQGSFLGGATFRRAVLLDADFTGADLRSVELDGAFVLRADFLDALAAVAAKDTFRPDRYVLEPSSIDALLEVDSAYQAISAEDIPQIEGDFRVWQVRRVKPFEQAAE